MPNNEEKKIPKENKISNELLLRIEENNIDKVFKDNEGQTVEYFLKQMTSDVKRVVKEFASQKYDLMLCLNVLQQSNFVYIEKRYYDVKKFKF